MSVLCTQASKLLKQLLKRELRNIFSEMHEITLKKSKVDKSFQQSLNKTHGLETRLYPQKRNTCSWIETQYISLSRASPGSVGALGQISNLSTPPPPN